MTIATPTLHELVPRSDSTRLSELADDLAALWPTSPQDVDGWMSRPSILRRVAGELAARLAADTDRVVALGPGALVLGGAVSLSTGLPFCAVDDEGTVFGDHHAGETAGVISVDGNAEEPGWLSTLDVSRRLSVVHGGGSRIGGEVLISRLPLRRDTAASEPEGNDHD
ncbi:hypothetical protein FB562_2339 [Homoserinimonas aerilata]|uniref:Uncharacterized protein n=1 Tax=Homoserinimonas aerilata TaxID=1162970 RepID=A0A542YA49_9MICO|nr:hypothetical protein [Homoserinimonas aerilata]TQL44932.1 hypothetical protein FB562_2339 [Homoserinimonas aerilata]